MLLHLERFWVTLNVVEITHQSGLVSNHKVRVCLLVSTAVSIAVVIRIIEVIVGGPA